MDAGGGAFSRGGANALMHSADHWMAVTCESVWMAQTVCVC
jgi:hypothetical protein